MFSLLKAFFFSFAWLLIMFIWFSILWPFNSFFPFSAERSRSRGWHPRCAGGTERPAMGRYRCSSELEVNSKRIFRSFFLMILYPFPNQMLSKKHRNNGLTFNAKKGRSSGGSSHRWKLKLFSIVSNNELRNQSNHTYISDCSSTMTYLDLKTRANHLENYFSITIAFVIRWSS